MTASGDSTVPCLVHPDRWAKRRCSGCERTFCDDCLVEVFAGRWCLECKQRHVPRRRRQLVVGGADAAALLGAMSVGLTLIPLLMVDMLGPDDEALVLVGLALVLAGLGAAIGSVIAARIAVVRTRAHPALRGKARALAGAFAGAQVLGLCFAVLLSVVLA